jgi:hypothetical protein
MPDFEAIRRAVIDRRTELKRMLDLLTTEAGLLQGILDALDGRATSSPDNPAPPSPLAPPASPARLGSPPPLRERDDAGQSRSRRPQSGQTRTEQALDVIAARPGITPAELGQAMDLHPQYLYRLLPRLAKAGRVVKRGRGYRIADDTPEHDPRR